MLHWELAPTNAGVLAKNGVRFALTSHGLDKGANFMANVRKAIKNGLTEKDALKALTSQLLLVFLGMGNQIGSLKKGSHANFLITNGNLF